MSYPPMRQATPQTPLFPRYGSTGSASTAGMIPTSSYPPPTNRAPGLAPGQTKTASTPTPSTATPSASSTSTNSNPNATGEHAKAPSGRIARDKQDQLDSELRSAIPLSPLYGRLLGLERQLDAALLRKKLACQEALPREARHLNTIPLKLRFCVYNTHENQSSSICATAQERVRVAQEPGCWTLRIEGKIVDDAPKQLNLKIPKFSFFFKSIFVQLDPKLWPDMWHIEWTKSTVGDSDGFEIKRLGSVDTMAHIFLHVDYSPSRYKVSAGLTHLLGLQGANSKTVIIHALWQYIQTHKLQDPQDPTMVILNQELRSIFGRDTIPFSDIPQQLVEHLSPPEPIQISYPIKTSGAPSEQWYEIMVDVPHPLPTSDEPDKEELEKLNNQTHELLRRIEEHRVRRRFFLDFAENPILFMEDFIATQVREQRMLQAKYDVEQERHSSFYFHPAVETAVSTFIQRQLNNGQYSTEEPTNMELDDKISTPTTKPAQAPTPIAPIALVTPSASTRAIPPQSLPHVGFPHLPRQQPPPPHSLIRHQHQVQAHAQHAQQQFALLHQLSPQYTGIRPPPPIAVPNSTIPMPTIPTPPIPVLPTYLQIPMQSQHGHSQPQHHVPMPQTGLPPSTHLPTMPFHYNPQYPPKH